MLYREIIAVCSQIHTKHVNTMCGQNVELLNVKAGGTYISYNSHNKLFLLLYTGLTGLPLLCRRSVFSARYAPKCCTVFGWYLSFTSNRRLRRREGGPPYGHYWLYSREIFSYIGWHSLFLCRGRLYTHTKKKPTAPMTVVAEPVALFKPLH